ncbi:hypothetical protein E2C01_074380 [Portunus trituberculatus]|uniref:Uncharacterized protein n=1 Tax=Portunus trituberculatus TaxID=210409 RepID=A0A5B7I7W2_PORTR|nr:hypothetical protein [Portunus trituberculatus]
MILNEVQDNGSLNKYLIKECGCTWMPDRLQVVGGAPSH